MAGWRISDVIKQDDVLNLVKKQKDLNFSPGDKFLYSNTGFMLLAKVVEKVSGKPFSYFAEQNIFNPLQMENTIVYDDYQKVLKNRAYSYYTGKEGLKKGVLNIEAVGQGNIYSTVNDLALWVKNLQEPVVGDTVMINKMNKLQVLNNGNTFGGALGQFVREYRGLKEIQHPGRTAGFNSYVSRFPDQDFSVVILSNASEIEEDEIANLITNIYLKDQFAEVKMTPTKKEEQNPGTEFEVNKKILENYIGDYELEPGVIISFYEEDGELIGKPTGGSTFRLSPKSQTEFIAEGDMKFVFNSLDGKKAEFLNFFNGRRNFHMTRVVPFNKAEVILEDYTGIFHSDEISVTYEIKLIDKELRGLSQNLKLNTLRLDLVKEDMAVSNSPLYREVKFVRDQNNKITGFKASSERVKNLWFKKVDQ